MKKYCKIIFIFIFIFTIVGCTISSGDDFPTIQKNLEELGYTIQLDEYSNEDEDFDLHSVTIISSDYRTSVMITLLDSKEAYIVFRDAGADILDIAKVFNKDIGQLTGVSEVANSAYEQFMSDFLYPENTILDFATWFYENNQPALSLEKIGEIIPHTPIITDTVLTTTFNSGTYVITFDNDSRLLDMSYSNSLKNIQATTIYNKSGIDINEEALLMSKEDLEESGISFYQYLMYVTDYYIQNK